MTRTDWAEQFVAEFASTPLVDECVLLRPKYLDGVFEREVCDLMLVLRKQAILIQMKCQVDPLSRTGDKLERWVKKQAKAGLSQLQGAIRMISDSELWCDHPRRGRITFSRGELRPVYGVVLTEHFDERIPLEVALPLTHRDVPISYFTVNDFLNLIYELRAFPEILSYLETRGNLTAQVRLGVGGESVLFQHYLLNEKSFSAWTTYQEVSDILGCLRPQVGEVMKAKKEADLPAYEVEKLVSGVASNVQINGPVDRSLYLKIQEELLDLPLVERRKLGMQIIAVREKLKASENTCIVRGVAWFDVKPLLSKLAKESI
jgi:hypothetical protein